VPGAIILAVGLQLISIVVTYLIEPRVANSQSTYGALGVAATLLFGLYLISRLVIASAIVNLAIWDRGSAGGRSGRP
jgi:uncharacterized BrkB/YihY/UPF0761 family membrane protein